MQTVVGLYDTQAKANEVKRILTTKGFSNVSVIDQSGEGYRTGSEGINAEHDTVGGKIKHFFSSLTGDGDNQYAHEQYSRGVNNGGALVAVQVEENRAYEVADLLEQQGASEVQDDSTNSGGSYATSGTGTGVYDAGDRNYGTGTGTLMADAGTVGTGNVTGYNDRDLTGTTASTGEQVIPVVAEDLVVGKRQVQRGGVRVFSHVVSQPVSEQVSLRDEQIIVDRRPVDRAATEADLNPESRSIELTATGEEAVVGKSSRVVEEVRVGKQAAEHVETVSDNVRHTEVDVEPIETEATTTF